MADSGLAAGGPPLPMAVSTDRIMDRALARPSTWLGSDVLAVFDAFVVLGLLGLYLKVALLAPQWGAVARFLGKQPGEKLGMARSAGLLRQRSRPEPADRPGRRDDDRRPRLRRVARARRLRDQRRREPRVFRRAAGEREVGQYISGGMLHDFIGWSIMHASSASDYLTTASLMKLFPLLATLCGVLLAARVPADLDRRWRVACDYCWRCRRRSRWRRSCSSRRSPTPSGYRTRPSTRVP